MYFSHTIRVLLAPVYPSLVLPPSLQAATEHHSELEAALTSLLTTIRSPLFFPLFPSLFLRSLFPRRWPHNIRGGERRQGAGGVQEQTRRNLRRIAASAKVMDKALQEARDEAEAAAGSAGSAKATQCTEELAVAAAAEATQAESWDESVTAIAEASADAKTAEEAAVAAAVEAVQHEVRACVCGGAVDSYYIAEANVCVDVNASPTVRPYISM